jgi:hypothetical protein
VAARTRFLNLWQTLVSGHRARSGVQWSVSDAVVWLTEEMEWGFGAEDMLRALDAGWSGENTPLPHTEAWCASPMTTRTSTRLAAWLSVREAIKLPGLRPKVQFTRRYVHRPP